MSELHVAHKAVDLFCGAGGFSLGARQAGLDVVASFDLDPTLTFSYEANFPGGKLLLQDVARLDRETVLGRAGGQVDAIFGGPPCQGFSDIGRRDVEDPRRQLLGHFFRIVAEVRPKFFVMENVRGLAYSDARGVLDDALLLVRDRYELLGPMILDSSEFGAATKRRRLFVIGIGKDDGDPLAPEDIQAQRRAPATVVQALSDLAKPVPLGVDVNGFDRWKIAARGRANAYAAKMRSDDRTFTSHRIIEHRSDVAARFAKVQPGEIDRVGRHHRLEWDGQCPTLRAGTGADRGSYQAVRPLHPSESRVITVREAARLQGFPDRHHFHPTTWHSFRMIGNSVSPIISEAIFRAINKKVKISSPGLLAAE